MIALLIVILSISQYSNNLNSNQNHKEHISRETKIKIAGLAVFGLSSIIIGIIYWNNRKKQSKQKNILQSSKYPNFHPNANRQSAGYNNDHSNCLRRPLIKIADGTHSNLMPELNIGGAIRKAKTPLINNSAVCFPALSRNKEYKNSLLVLSRFKSQTIKSFSQDAQNHKVIDLINLVKHVNIEYTNHSSRQLIYCNGPGIASSPDHIHVQIRFNLDEGHNTQGRKITKTQWDANYVCWNEKYYSHIESSNSYNVFVKANNTMSGDAKDILIQAKTSSDPDSLAVFRQLQNLIPNHNKYRVYWQFKNGRLMFVIKNVSQTEACNLDFTKL